MIDITRFWFQASISCEFNRLTMICFMVNLKHIKNIGGNIMSLENKKVLVIGDRDGIPGQAIEECLKGTSAEVIFSSTECFV